MSKSDSSATTMPPMDRGQKRFLRDGDWSKFGWRAIAERIRFLRLDPDPIRDQLVDLFPADVCSALARRGVPMVMAPLFARGLVPSTDDMITLGLDLTLCGRWRKAQKLIKDLQSVDEHTAARFEVSVWAALRRMGTWVSYERADTPGGKAADFRFRDDGLRVALEAKTLLPSPAEANGFVIHDLVRDVAFRVGADGTSLRFQVREEIMRAVENEKNTRRFETSVEGVFSSALTWASRFDHDLPVGAHEVPGLGSVVVSAHCSVGMPWEISNLTEDSRKRNVRRALRLVLQGADQVRAQKSADVRAVVVRTSPWRIPVETAALDLQAALREANPSEVARYRQLDAIVLANGPREKIHVSTFRWSRAGVENMSWVHALAWRRTF